MKKLPTFILSVIGFVILLSWVHVSILLINSESTVGFLFGLFSFGVSVSFFVIYSYLVFCGILNYFYKNKM